MKWRQSRIRPIKQNWMEQCLDSLRNAVEHDANDHLVHFYLALTYALCRQVSQALNEVRTALRMRCQHLPSLILLALLLSTTAASSSSGAINDADLGSLSCNEYDGAFSLVEASLEEYPQNFDLLYVKALLEEKCHGGEAALVTAKEMLALWKILYEDSCTSQDANPTAQSTLNHSSFDSRSLAMSTISAQPLSNELGERDNGLLRMIVYLLATINLSFMPGSIRLHLRPVGSCGTRRTSFIRRHVFHEFQYSPPGTAASVACAAKDLAAYRRTLCPIRQE